MTIGTIKTKGTRLYFATPLDASSGDSDGITIKYVKCATGIQGLGGAADQVDITCLDSAEREFVQGMSNPGQITVPFNILPDSAAHQALFALKDSGDTVSWMVAFSDAVEAGTVPVAVDSNLRLVSVGPTTAEFLGYVSDVTIDIQTNEIVRGSLIIQRSGAIAWDWPAITQ
jgi:hypothetical protein